MERGGSSSRPISSKWVMSESRASAPLCEEDLEDDDLEDLDTVKPGGEEGAWATMEVISW